MPNFPKGKNYAVKIGIRHHYFKTYSEAARYLKTHETKTGKYSGNVITKSAAKPSGKMPANKERRIR